jgi:UDP-N-acetylmuramoylalanine--D-glutamate ligase
MERDAGDNQVLGAVHHLRFARDTHVEDQMRTYRTAWVLGLGLSGTAAARCLLEEGTAVGVFDSGDTPDLRSAARELGAMGADVTVGENRLPDGAPEVCIVSPGIPRSSEWVREIERRGVSVVPEIDIGAERCSCAMIGVTGSNGKSTMVTLCRDLLLKAGYRADCAGNIGTPLSAVAARSRNLDFVVVEVSSFQLEAAGFFAPHVGVVMNIAPNHLDRHAGMEEYKAAKARIFARMKRDDVGIVPLDLIDWARNVAPGGNKWVTFGRGAGADCVYADHRVEATGGKPGSVSLSGMVFDSHVLGVTAAAALGVCRALSLDSDCLEAAMREFKPLPHRLQAFASVNGVRYVDDSKGTNLSAMTAAVRSMGPGVRLIAGGILKETDLEAVKKCLAMNVKKVYLLGASEEAMAEAWGDAVECSRCRTIDVAVARAMADAVSGETVLLSPGCSSFDQFSGYAERGGCFQKLVLRGIGPDAAPGKFAGGMK